MPFPEHLLPLPDFCVIEWRQDLCEYYLLRATPSSDFVDQETGCVRVRFILDEGQSRDILKDYSTNLVGIFMPEDAAIEWTKNEKKAYFTSAWNSGETIELPTPEDFIIRADFGYFFYPINVLHHFPQPISIPKVLPETQAMCYVCHTPTKGNFWHFSVRWKIGQDDIEAILSKNERKNLLSLVRVFLTEHAIINLSNDQFLYIPEVWYKPTLPNHSI
jgi:hypothetical protein